MKINTQWVTLFQDLPGTSKQVFPCVQRTKYKTNHFGGIVGTPPPPRHLVRPGSPLVQTLHGPVAGSISKPLDASLNSCHGLVTVIPYLAGKDTGQCTRLILCLFNLLIYHLWDMILNPLQSKVTENHSGLTALKDHK